MGLVLPQEVEMKWNGNNKKRYIDKGYRFTKLGGNFLVNVKDLANSSQTIVKCICDNCEKNMDVMYGNYTRLAKDNGKYYCNKCSKKIFGINKCKQTKLKNSISFKRWCNDNLPKEKADKILLRWDYEKNKCDPDEIAYTSRGIKDNGYWFKCLDCIEHKSEQKNISSFVLSSISMKCNQCNAIAHLHPNLIKYFVKREDAFSYSYGSTQNVLMQCPNCGYKKEQMIRRLVKNGFGCNKCSDGVSYPEKYFINMLEQLNIKFISQYNKTHAEWCNKFKYDFCLVDYNIICEVHGEVHYKGWNSSKDNLEFQKQNDNQKKSLALQNSVDKYIEIDARYSDVNWIKQSVLSSELSNIFDFKKVNWNKCHENALSSLVKIACDYWNDGINSTKIISGIMKLKQKAIIEYLKKGSKIGLCNYNPKLSHRRKVICLNTGEIFDKINDVINTFADINYKCVGACCRGLSKTSGKHPITNEPLKWMYYEDYIKELSQIV